MQALRQPLLPIGFVLVCLGFGNWYTGRDKGAEYERLLAKWDRPAAVEQFAGFTELDAHTTAMLLRTLDRGNDEYSLANSKLEFYKVVQSGGRLLALVGLFCAAIGLVRSWYHRHRRERDSPLPVS